MNPSIAQNSDNSNSAANSAANSVAAVAKELTKQLQDSPPRITKMGNTPIPKQNALVDSLEMLQRVLFPGYRDADATPDTDVSEFISSLLEKLSKNLCSQIAQAFILNKCFKTNKWERDCGDVQFDELTNLNPCSETLEHAEATTAKFLASLPEIRRTLDKDVQAALDGDPACTNMFEVILCYPGFHAITTFRLAHRLHQLGVPLLPRMMTEWVHSRTGIDIHPGAQIGEHFFIDHGTGVVIGETCEIGRHVKLYQGVTLGALSFSHDEHGKLIREAKRHPTIEDHVVIYANATILGGDTVIGRDSVVGSSVWLTKSVEPNTTVMMEKPKLRMRNPRSDEESGN